MKQIPLTKGKFALVDDEDYEYLSQHKWHFAPVGYAARNVRLEKNVYKVEYMHRRIKGLTWGDSLLVDHKNGNGLDNQKENLRVCTKTQNQQNQRKRKTRASKYKGVGFFKRDQKWRARIVANRKDIELGKFETERDAALAYNEAAIKYHGEFAWLNKVD